MENECVSPESGYVQLKHLDFPLIMCLCIYLLLKGKDYVYSSLQSLQLHSGPRMILGT